MTIAFPPAKRVATNGIELEVHEQGEGPLIVLCHGFPEIAYSWRYQIPALAAKGYRVVAPNQRGYAGSDRPPAVTDYDQFVLIDDLMGLLDYYGEEDALFVGHDWGALLLWQMALLKPERMRGLVTLNIPFAPRRAVDPMVMTRQVLGDDFYIINFQDSDEADRAFEADTERFLAAMYRRLPATREAFNRLKPEQRQAFSMLREMKKDTFPGTPLLEQADFDVFVDAFKQSGFTPAINWYRNWSRNWQLTEGLQQFVNLPTLFIGAEDDILITPEHVETMRQYVDDLEVHMIADCGHWTQQEHPAKVNNLITEWLGRRFPAVDSR